MLIFEPFRPWSYIALAAAIAGVLLLLGSGLLDFIYKRELWPRLGGNRKTRGWVLILSILTALLFSISAMNPRLADKPGLLGFHLQVAVDVSDSVLRTRGGWEQIKKNVKKRIDKSIAHMPGLLRDQCTAGILTFRDNSAEAFKKRAIEDLPRIFGQLEPNMFASGGGTDIREGLRHAAGLLEKNGSPGAVLLISDGNQTAGDGITVAQELARQGVPVHVYPITSPGPAVAITDADLPRQINSGVKSYVRGVMLNRLFAGLAAELTLKKGEGGEGAKENQKNDAIETTQKVMLPSGKWVRFRWPVLFTGFGIRFVDLALTPEGSSESHYRRFYTYIKRPPRIMAIGGDNRWISALPTSMAEIIPIEPFALITRDSLKEIDAVVISGVPAHWFDMSSLFEIAEAVKIKGMGLMLINGGHQGADAETETVVMSYETTPLEPLLPVYGGPRPFRDEPRSRHVAILVDTSGSMSTSMWKGKFIRRIDKAREIAKYIVSELLRPQDYLDLITFTTGYGHLVKNKPMNEENKADALRRIDRISPTGGTNPNRALSLIGKRNVEECGLIFISDGEFNYVGFRPDCRTTVFKIGGGSSFRNSAIKKLADPIPVDAYFDPKAITIPFFEPEERLKFFEEGTFTPLSMADYLPKKQRLPVPPLDLQGSAVSHLKENAVLNGVRPKLTDPVLVYGEGGAGYVGFFASEIQEQWLREEKGREAVQAWISRLIPFMERDRYDFQLEDRGDEIHLRISLVAKSGRIPDVGKLSVTIQFPNQETVGIAMKPDEQSAGTFAGEIRVKRGEQPRSAFLSIRESGPGALPRSQRIPIAIPPKGNINRTSHSEAQTYGQNRELLKRIAEASGGVYDPAPGTPFFKEKSTAGQGKPLWPYWAAAAVLCYLAAVALKRWNA